MSKKKFFTTKMIVTLGLLLGMSIILERVPPFSFMIPPNVRIAFGNLPIILAGLMFGPIAGGIVGLLSDVIGTSLLSSYAWFPPMALTPVIMGVVPPLIGMLFRKRSAIWLFIVIILPAEILGPMLWSTLSLHWLNGAPYLPTLILRMPFKAGIAVVDILMAFLLYKSGLFRALGIDRFGGKKDELRANTAVHSQR